jgi:hypothetical protein
LQEGLANQRCRPCRPDRRIAVGLFIVAFVTFAWFFGGGGWNQNAHFDLTRALVERQTLHIDGYRVNTGDISWNRDRRGEYHAYSNKPPGLPFLAALPYAAMHAVERRMTGVSLDSWGVMTLNVWLLTLITCAIPGALIAAVIYTYTRRANAPPPGALFAALTVAFGTIVFPFATVFYSPVPAALFLLLAFVWRRERPLLAGAAAGIATTCFYMCAFGALVILIDLLLRDRRGGETPPDQPPGRRRSGAPASSPAGRAASRRQALRFIAGGVPFAILIGIYHTLCFGAPWRTSLEVASSFTEKGLFLGLFRTGPTREALWGLTFSEYRGLFFVSPVLLLAFLGLPRMPKRERVMILAIALLFLLAVASFNGWEGGFAFGPRHILPMIPLLAIPLAFLRGRVLLAIGVLLLVASASMQFIAAAVDVQPNAAIRYPVRDYLLPTFLKGSVSVNRQGVDELLPNAQHAPDSRESLFAAFNAGEYFVGADRRSSVIPIAVWMIAGSALLGVLALRHEVE